MTLLGRLFLLFVLVPIIELVLLIQLGQVVGVLPTVGLVLLTGAVGAWLARKEGVRVFLRFQQELASGRLPGQSLFDGISVLIGGALLLTPGVLTDLLGFGLLVPVSRGWIQRVLRRRLERRIQEGSIRVVTFGGSGAGGFGFHGFGGGSGFGPGRGTGQAPSRGEVDPDAHRRLDPRHEIEVPADDR